MVQPQHMLQGRMLIVAALLLALANFIVVLDITIANVSVSHIAGALAISPNEGTYVITSYAVAEAITVPLTGWLAQRFGTLRVFTTSVMLFGIFSALCGLSNSLGILVTSRILQGLAGGPLIPLSQTLLMQIFPKEKQSMAIGLWSMTTLMAPIMGPIVGGWICDNWGWEFIFYINIPIAVFCSMASLRLLRGYETPAQKHKFDTIGLILLVAWVAALQLMLDEGKNYDWFESKFIWTLAIMALLGFISFVIWEITQKKSIVNLFVFKNLGYTMSVITICLGFGAYFGSIVLTPLWLQIYMGYTATASGLTTAALGTLSIFMSPIAAQLAQKKDPRKLVFCGIMWIGFWTFFRSFAFTDMTNFQIGWPMLIQGLGMPLFFIPLTRLALFSVKPEETASAAGLMSFCRTLSGAIATSIVTTAWDSQANIFRTDMVARIQPETLIEFAHLSPDSGPMMLDRLIQSQAIILATNHIFTIVSIIFVVAACLILIAPFPKRLLPQK